MLLKLVHVEVLFVVVSGEHVPQLSPFTMYRNDGQPSLSCTLLQVNEIPKGPAWSRIMLFGGGNEPTKYNYYSEFIQ